VEWFYPMMTKATEVVREQAKAKDAAPRREIPPHWLAAVAAPSIYLYPAIMINGALQALESLTQHLRRDHSLGCRAVCIEQKTGTKRTWLNRKENGREQKSQGSRCPVQDPNAREPPELLPKRIKVFCMTILNRLSNVGTNCLGQ
jgi:hypothetical protein